MNKTLNSLFKKHNGYLTRKQLPDKSTYNHLLYWVAAGAVDRLKRGVYCCNEFVVNQQMIDVGKIVPGGVLCLYSAWVYYELTVQIPGSFHIAIEKQRKVTVPDYPPVTLYYWNSKYHDLGVTSQKTGGITVKIYDLEKSICDAVRYRSKTGMETTAEIINNYLKRPDRNLSKLMEYAKKLRVEAILKTYLEILL